MAGISRPAASGLFLSRDDGPMNEEERMAAVRTLQDSFYQTTTCEAPSLDAATGIMRNLPLWRVGWVELPGRSNCLLVHEGQYTHMFEQLLRGPEPWYFGHLYLQGGSRNLRSTPLVTHRQDTDLSAQVGCLMRIRDYKRRQDGCLVLFVQVMERFVVDTVLQSLPYSMAHVQILPDTPSPTVDPNTDENLAALIRAKQVQTAFKYCDYEFAETKLPKSHCIDPNSKIDFKELQLLQFSFYAQTESLLPYSFYSQDDSMLKKIIDEEEQDTDSNDHDDIVPSYHGGPPSLECQLLERGILKEPSSIRKSADTAEMLIWLALEEYSRNLQVLLPEQVLCLKPPEMDYLDLPDAGHPISPDYPKSRRQHRLSYTAAGFLDTDFWQVLLELPSTEVRLEAVLGQLQEKKGTLYSKFQ